MKKYDVIKEVSSKVDCTQKVVEDILSAYSDVVVEAFQEGEDRIPLIGLGAFRLKTTKARTCRNPQTGEPIDVPAKQTLKFSFSQSVKEEVTEEM